MNSRKAAASGEPVSDTDAPVARAGLARERIVEAVIAVLAAQGPSGLTHRRVAAVAGVSLGATTYHFLTMGDMIAATSHRILDEYLQSFQTAATSYESRLSPYRSVEQVMARVVHNVLERDRGMSLAWFEIMLEAAHRPDGREIARTWYAELSVAWRALLAALGLSSDDCAARTAIDIVIGKFFIAHSLGLSADQMMAVEHGADPRISWTQACPPDALATALPQRRTPKARATRARIVQGAIDLLVAEGAGAVSYRAVAVATGLAVTAPGYYFGSIEELLREAQRELARSTRERYEQMFTSSRSAALSVDRLADINTAIFIREATGFTGSAVAYYSVSLEGARRPELRAQIMEALFRQAEAWKYCIDSFGSATLNDGLHLQALFIGKLMRAITSGAPVQQLAEARQEFRYAIDRITG